MAFAHCLWVRLRVTRGRKQQRKGEQVKQCIPGLSQWNHWVDPQHVYFWRFDHIYYSSTGTRKEKNFIRQSHTHYSVNKVPGIRAGKWVWSESLSCNHSSFSTTRQLNVCHTTSLLLSHDVFAHIAANPRGDCVCALSDCLTRLFEQQYGWHLSCTYD